MAENSKDKSINISPVPKCVNNFINNCLENQVKLLVRLLRTFGF